MIDYSMFPRDHVLCLDMKSFYASIEAADRGLDPLKCLLVVVGDTNRSGSVVLASSPAMKKLYKIKTGNRLFEVPADPNIHIVGARMQHYLDVSTSITELLNNFAPMEAIHTYSVDESWINMNGSEKLFGTTWEAAERIRQEILFQFNLPCCIGIGPNKLLAKVILDIEAKKVGIAECQYEDVPKKLWPQPIKEMWGIGSRMERNLQRMGIRTVGHLANFSLDALKRKFGVMGEQLYYHANGIDLSPSINKSEAPPPKGIGHGITLLRDYTELDEIKTVILELSEEVARRTREAKMAGRTISLGIGYSRHDLGGGFHRSRSLDQPTNITMDIYRTCLELFRENYREGVVRKINVAISNLTPDTVIQLDLFDNKEKQRDLGHVMDVIRAKYGSTALLRAKSYTSGGTTIYRSGTVGGHKA